MRNKKQEKLAELVGVILGDGHFHGKANRIFISGSLWDKEYYEKKIMVLFKELFNVEPKLYKVKNKNSYFLQVENKKVFNILISEIGMIRGAKKGRVKIPNMFIKNKNLIPFILRGLFDTDGCIKFSKQTKGYTYYPRVRLFANVSPMLYQMKKCLDILNFNYSFHKSYNKGLDNVHVFEISGKENLHKWMKIVGSSNPVHYTKYLVWKKFGYYDKYWDLNTRFNLLDLK